MIHWSRTISFSVVLSRVDCYGINHQHQTEQYYHILDSSVYFHGYKNNTNSNQYWQKVMWNVEATDNCNQMYYYYQGSVYFDFLEILLFVFIHLPKFINFVHLSIDKFQLNSYDFMSSAWLQFYIIILRWLSKLGSCNLIILLAHSWFSHRKLWL